MNSLIVRINVEVAVNISGAEPQRMHDLLIGFTEYGNKELEEDEEYQHHKAGVEQVSKQGLTAHKLFLFGLPKHHAGHFDERLSEMGVFEGVHSEHHVEAQPKGKEQQPGHQGEPKQ